MSDDLNALLRGGKLQFVSLDRLADGRWEATYRGRNRNAQRQATRDDPVDALLTVMQSKSQRPSPPPQKPKMDDLL